MYISEDRVRELLTYDALIPAIREALIDYSAGRVEQPARTILRSAKAADGRDGWFAVMPVIYRDVMGVKTVTFFPGNAERGLPTHMAMIELLSRETGEPLAVMDGRLITEMRTAAVSTVALDALARKDVRSLGVLGAGVQARAHLRALRMVRPGLKDVRIWSRRRESAEKLATETGARAAAIKEAADADVVLTATASPEPVLMGRWLRPEVVVLAVGAVGSSLRELDDEVMRTSWVVAESRQGAEREAGDVVLSGTRIEAEIGEILARKSAVDVPVGRRILFKSVGMAIEDVVAARMVWKRRDEGV